MARERYLVGVNKEELKRKTEEPRKPMTFREKLDNLWYHYRALICFGLFVVAAAVFVIVQTVTQERPDYRICMAAMTYVPDEIVASMEIELEKYGKDLNGDGKVSVEIQSLNVAPEQVMTNGMAAMGRQTVMAHIASRNVAVFAFAPEYYALMEDMMEDGSTFFAPINGDETYYDWKVLEFAHSKWDGISAEIEKLIPTDMYIGVRNMGDDLSDSEREMVQSGTALLQAYFSAAE